MPSAFTWVQVATIVIALCAIFVTSPLSPHLPHHLTSYLPAPLLSLLHLSPIPHPPLPPPPTLPTCIPPIPGQLIAAPLTLLPPPGTRVLVTGAAGFIGSHLSLYLSTTLHLHVIAVDDLSGGFTSNLPPSPSPLLTFVQGDVSSPAFISHLFHTHGPFHTVYHLAAYAAEGLSHFIRRFNYHNNLLASVTLLNAAVLHNTSTFVFTSSIAVYGPLPPPVHEGLPPHPHDPYGIAKLAFELDLAAAGEMWGLRWVVWRPHNVYGEHQNVVDRYRNVVGIFVSRVMRGMALPVFGDGGQTRAFSYVGDVVPVVAAGAFVEGAMGRVMNVGGDEATSVRELARVVSEAMGVEERVEWLDERKEVVHAVADHRLVRCVMGLGEQVGLEEGVRRVVEWVRQKKDDFVPVEFDEVEVMKNMPPSWVTDKMRDNERKKTSRQHASAHADGE